MIRKFLTISAIFGATLTASAIANAEQLTLSASKDTFLRAGAPNTNEGANTLLSVRKAGHRRAVIAFDLSSLSGRTINAAVLRMYISKNGANWGKSGGNIAAYRMDSDWTEGNGSNAKPARGESDNSSSETLPTSNRGSGSGATWKCAVDTDVSNTKPNCTTRWNGGSFESTLTSSKKILNSTSGYVEFDVTADVVKFADSTATNYGWVIKKVSMDKAGALWFNSKEAASNTPQLVVDAADVTP